MSSSILDPVGHADDATTPPGSDTRTFHDEFVAYRRTSAPEIRDRLVLAHRGLAYSLAARYRNRGQELEDLRQVAVIGLIKAVQRFDPDRGVAFSSFAVPTILGELKRHFRDHAWMVRVPRSLKDLRRRADRTRSRLTQQLGRAPTLDEVAGELDVDPSELLVAMDGIATCYRPDALDARARDHPQQGEASSDRACDRTMTQQLLAQLDERERRILALRFHDDLTQQAIADQIGISQMHVSRLLRDSLAKLRAAAA